MGMLGAHWAQHRGAVAMWLAVCVVVLMGALCRVWATDIHRQIVQGDETTYWYSAKTLLKSHTLTRDVSGDMYRGTRPLEPTAALSPGYPLFIAGVLAVGGGVFALYVCNILFSIAVMLLALWMMAQLRLGRIPILIALGLCAFYPGFVYNLNRMLTEQLYVVLFLLFANFLLKAIKTSGTGWALATGALLAVATNVRAEAAPFLAVAILFAILNGEKKTRFRLGAMIFAAFVVVMLPWWIRNLATFHRLLLLTDAGSGTARWGATPYYIDMPSSYGSVADVIKRNATPDPWLFVRWRAFGFLQYMWGDLWDEQLVHPIHWLRTALLIQPLGVVLPMILSPLLAYKKRWMTMFVAIVPIGYTLLLEPIQALPRYVFPAVPFVFILVAVLLSKKAAPTARSEWDVRWLRISYVAGSTLFGLLLAYSVFVFQASIPGEQSAYRLARYQHVHLRQLESPASVETIPLAEHAVDGTRPARNGWLKSNVDSTPILHVDVRPLGTGEPVVTKVQMFYHGGFYYDRSIIYWATPAHDKFDESRVYVYPTTKWSKQATFYIDGDVDRLMIVPFEFRRAKFKLDRIVVTKFVVADGFRSHK